MKKMLPLLVVGILVLSGLGAVALPSGEEFELKTISVNFSKPIIKNENEYVTINVDEANSFIMKQGKPMLPSYVHTFTFPFGTKIKSVTCTPSNIQTQTISKDIMPTPKAVIVGQTVSTSQESVNYGTEPYPSNWYEYDVLTVEGYREYLSNIFHFRPQVPTDMMYSGHAFMLVLHVFFANIFLMFFKCSETGMLDSEGWSRAR